MKKAISLLLAVAVLCGVGINVCAATPEMKLSYEHKTDFPTTDAAGTNDWLYQYNPGEKYSEYVNLEWNASGTSYVRRDGSGNVDNYVSKWSLHPGGPGPTAIVWVAPNSGRVRLTTNGGVCKSGDKGSEVFASIVHADSKSENAKQLWYKVIEGSDTTGTQNTYNIETDVKIGDKIYFEIDCNTTASAATVWNPQVTYVECLQYSVGNTRLSSVDEISSGAVVTAEYYREETMTETEKGYIVVYDDEGRLRNVGVPEEYILGASCKTHQMMVTLPTVSDGESYKDWQLSFVTLTTQSGRYFPTVDLDKLSLK